jgi:CoA:oxalate CoA-transferase
MKNTHGKQMHTDTDTPWPLGGIRVLDLSRFIAGPFAGRLLADLGADVVKVEPPTKDVTRCFGEVRHGVSGLFLQQNAGKRNVCIDLKAAGGTELVARLAAAADVVIENFRPGMLDSWNLGWPQLSAENPGLVMLSISGFGQTGPESHRQAYAPIIHAESGWVSRCHEMFGEEPRDSTISFADSIAGLHGVIALLAALRLRDRTGQGQHIDLAMLDAWFATDDSMHYLLDGYRPITYQGGEVWEAPGGPLMLNRDLPHVWKHLHALYGVKATIPPDADRETTHHAQRQAIRRWINSFASRDALKQALEAADLAWGEVRTAETVLSSPTIIARDTLATVEDRGGTRRVVQSPYRFSAAQSGVCRGAAYLGEHNAEVLAEWTGLADDDIHRLTEGHVLQAEQSI